MLTAITLWITTQSEYHSHVNNWWLMDTIVIVLTLMVLGLSLVMDISLAAILVKLAWWFITA